MLSTSLYQTNSLYLLTKLYALHKYVCMLQYVINAITAELIITTCHRCCRKVMFSLVSVCPQGGVHAWSQVPLGGGCACLVSGPFQGCACLVPGPFWGCMPGPRFLLRVGMPGTHPTGRYTPQKVKVHPLGTDIWWWPPKRAVRILLECILDIDKSAVSFYVKKQETIYGTQVKHREFHLGWNVVTMN